MKSRQNSLDQRSGQGVWLFITILTFILFAVSITFVVLEIKFYHDEGVWPADDGKNFFYKRAKSGVDPAPPSDKPTPAPDGSTPVAAPTPAPAPDGTNAAPADATNAAPDGAAAPATP